MDLPQRLDVFLRRLADATPAANADEALRLVCRPIEEVEDELCPVPRRTPAPEEFTGRMYAPQTDRVERLADGAIKAMTRRHRIYCGTDGRINVFHKISRTPVLNKAGKR